MNDKCEQPPETRQIPMLRLLQLNSPNLPVGSYAYSQGLEWAVEADWVNNPELLKDWLTGVMQGSVCRVDIPIMQRLYQALQGNQQPTLQYWNDCLLAYRDSSELRKEELDKGKAIFDLLDALNIANMAVSALQSPTFLAGYCYASVAWRITLEDSAVGYVWGWLENQIISAMKLMPLGQIASQSILDSLLADIPAMVEFGLELQDDELGALLPAQAMACALHETQYSRLFRS